MARWAEGNQVSKVIGPNPVIPKKSIRCTVVSVKWSGCFNGKTRLTGEAISLSAFEGLMFPVWAFVRGIAAIPGRVAFHLDRLTPTGAGAVLFILVSQFGFSNLFYFAAVVTRNVSQLSLIVVPASLRAKYLLLVIGRGSKDCFTNRASLLRGKPIHPFLMALRSTEYVFFIFGLSILSKKRLAALVTGKLSTIYQSFIGAPFTAVNRRESVCLKLLITLGTSLVSHNLIIPQIT